MRKNPLLASAFAAVLTLASMLVSCKPSLPSDVLSKGEMEDILYDYHIALAMASAENYNDTTLTLTYKTAVLKKHDVTSEEFDSSMVYYMRHADLMHDVYKNLAERMENEVKDLGGNAGGNNRFSNLSATGDTANIWRGATTMVFSPEKPFNCQTFDIKADSTFRKGDRFVLDLETQFIYQDGVRDGLAVVAYQFDNDSTFTEYLHMQSAQHYTLEFSNSDSLGVKRIKGFFLLGQGDFADNNSSKTTLKLMFLQNVKLIKMHPQPKKPEKSEDDVLKELDSVNVKKDDTQEESGSAPKPKPTPAIPPQDAPLTIDKIDAPLKTR